MNKALSIFLVLSALVTGAGALAQNAKIIKPPQPSPMIAAPVTRDDARVSETFEITVNGVTFRDAIVLSQSERDAMSDDDLAAMRQQRIDGFKATLDALAADQAIDVAADPAPVPSPVQLAPAEAIKQ